MLKRAWEYVVAVTRWYKGHISGWLLAVIAIGLSVAAALFANDPGGPSLVVKWSARLSVAAAIWVFLVAQYDAWRSERNKSDELTSQLDSLRIPKLDIVYEYGALPCHHEIPVEGVGTIRLLRVGVKNLSAQSVQEVGCKLQRIEPSIHGECLPVHLRCMRNLSGPLDPADTRWIDLVRNRTNDEIEILHCVPQLSLLLSQDTSYRITLFAHGSNCSCERTFVMALDDSGLVHLQPVFFAEAH
jgi:hypothetical protein